MWIYFQRTGELRLNDESIAFGYSGYGEAKNRHEDQHRPGLGPIPVGAYNIGAEREPDPHEVDRHGPVCMPLVPLPGTQVFGRSGFLVHGDSAEHPGAASHGCIILQRPVRERISNSHDRLLVVIP